jgi:antirestriction protein ArdC
MRSVKQYNDLDQKIVSREELKNIINQAEDEGQYNIVDKLVKYLLSYPEEETFEVAVARKIKPVMQITGLNGSKHKGLAKEGLNECGRLKKGYRFVGGKVVKAQTKSKAKPKEKVTKKRATKRKPAPKKTATKKPASKNSDLKERILKLRETFALNGLPEITQGLNGNYLADGHEILTDEMIEEMGSEIVGLNASAKDVEAIINEKILEKIKSGEPLPPWRKTWANYSPTLAMNFITKKPYSGSNAMILNLFVGDKYSSPYFLTANQAEKKGGNIKKGEKSTPLVLYNFSHYLKDLSSNPQQEEELLRKIRGQKIGGKKITKNNYAGARLTDFIIKKYRLDRKLYISKGFLRFFNVFNIEQTEGIKYENPETKDRSQNEIIERAEAIVKGFTDKPEIGYDKKSAFYIPTQDVVKLPKIDEFDNSQEYYSTLFHELIHSTKIEKRVNRDKFYKGKDKDTAYSFEELIAELGASYLCGIAGILDSVSINTSTYLKDWHKVLQKQTQSDQDFFVFATKEAQKAVDYILKGFEDPDEKGGEEEKTSENTDKKDQERKRRMRMRLRVLELEKQKNK